MSDIDELKQSAKNAPKRYEDILREIKGLTEYVTLIEGKKHEAEIVARIVDGLPEDHLVENAPRLLGLMQHDDAKLDQVSVALHSAKQEVVAFVSSGSASTASIYEVAVYAVNNGSFEQGAANAWLAPIRQEITVLAEEKQREQSLMNFLRTVHPDLAREFSETLIT